MAINQPQRAQATPQGGGQKEDIWDNILKGINLAGGVLGVRQSLQTYETHKQQQQLAQEQGAREASDYKRRQEGYVDPVTLAKMSEQSDIGDVAKPGAIALKIGDEANPTIKYVSSRTPKGESATEKRYREAEIANKEAQTKELLAKSEQAQNPNTRTAKLGSEDKKRFDNSLEALGAIKAMDEALASGDNTFSLKGDNNFTQARAIFTEAFGRAQSGGAIGKDELAKFERFAPGPMDSTEMQAKKLAAAKQAMESRLKTLGFDPRQIPETSYELSYGKNQAPIAGASVTAAPSKPKTVVQNGQTYTLNEKTGKYE